MNILNKVNLPEDVKKLELEELNELASEIRELLIKKVNETGGHMGPNLGMIEATIALHQVFNTPIDKIVFDVSHQCYTHKILTGRKENFINPEKYEDISGFTNPKESKYDYFQIGHTSTSVSLASGLAKARDLKGDNENIIAVIGDGSLSGGEAYEGLNNAAVLNSNFIVLVNDNEMSIAENQGGLYDNLKLLRDTNGKAELNFFKALGFDYIYVEEGNNIQELIQVFNKVKDINHPIVVHMHTLKGKGLAVAEQNKQKFHWILPGVLDIKNDNKFAKESYASITAQYILKKIEDDKTVVAISPATPGLSGFTKEFIEKAGKNYIDVGIAEEHAVAFASGIAANGGKPIIAMSSSFAQRTYDQLSQDLALNENPVTILIFGGGITESDSTHLGLFDIPLISNIPNIVYLAPTSKEEYLGMLKWSNMQKNHPVIIRVPNKGVVSTGKEDNTDYSVLNKFEITSTGSEIAIIGLGTFFNLAKELKEKIDEEFKINSTLINPKFITGIDIELLESLKLNHKLVITMEDGELDGGFGEKITRFYSLSDMKVMNFGAQKEFNERISLDELYERYELNINNIINKIKKHI